MTTSGSIPLLLFAKAPIAGKVKTRLMPRCSAQQASDIAELLMEASIQRACESWPGTVHISAWLDLEHDFFVKMQQRYSISVTPQCEGDLGEKMRHGLAQFGYPAAVMGCDAPHVLSSTLQQAYESLSLGKSVIGPSEDGGYYLLGLCQDADALFVGMPWGQDQVLGETFSRAASIDLSLHKLPQLNDVDEWQDLLSAAHELPSLYHYLQAQNLIEDC